ncbi:Helicase POLQ-like [Portunus trituberculatus]|uniref:Helicase POLQ-like n=1 Tax=Portunus trituberculatus TaxID=210409 RepID=A0A5B7FSU2_PORTR|nr:Helicase POLQ-like [Portunus trituberculatus]
MNDIGKTHKRDSELCSPCVDRINKLEGLHGNEENCSPVATSSPLLRRKIKRRRRLILSPEKPLKEEQSISSEKNTINDIKNESFLLIKDDSFFNHINFEKLDQLSATDGQSTIAPPPPLSPELFEEPSPVKTYESQGSILLPTQASLSSTLSSQPLVTRIQKNFKSEGEWQEDCIIKGGTGSNLLISMPTSGGKTLVAEVLIWQQLLLKNHDALFILPYVALVQEKCLDSEMCEGEVAISFIQHLTTCRENGDIRIVYVATIEKASGLVNSLLGEGRIKELGLVVVDEVHMVGEAGGRGATLENLLTTLRYTAPSVQMVGMSATVGNINELAEFLGAEIYENNFRPVHLIEYAMVRI